MPVEGSLMQVAFQYPSLPPEALALILLGTWIYLVYKAVIKKEDRFQKLLSGVEAVAGSMIILALFFIPAAAIAELPVVGPLLLWFLDLLVYALVGYFLALVTYKAYQVYVGEISIPGF